MKAKRRNVIVNGVRNFDVCQISATDYLNDLYSVYSKAYASYNKKPASLDKFKLYFIEPPMGQLVYAAFYKATGTLAAYATVIDAGKCIYLDTMKANPEYEKHKVNAALLDKIMTDLNSRINDGCYICDGARSISHETNFQDYLEKYFGFRKAFCSLHIQYNPRFRFLILACLHLKKILAKFDRINLIHQVNGVIKMAELGGISHSMLCSEKQEQLGRSNGMS